MNTLFDQPEEYAIDPVSEAIRDNARGLAKMRGDAIAWGPPVCSTPESARDHGVAKVSLGNLTWLEEAHKLIPKYPNDTATGEELRVWVEERLGPPDHVNVAGAFVRGAIRKGLLKSTGVYVKMKRVESHARVNPLYLINR